jgi:7-carboxy-7-deazaguanine synthase
MSYHVKEIYYTLQGEGANAGRPAVFCRFTGCNLWSGREKDRPTAVCNFCDTDFVGTDGPGGGVFPDSESLASTIASYWPNSSLSDAQRFVVCTGGEPLLQLDSSLIQALHKVRFAVAVETNGTCIPPDGVDWLCVSPKGRAELVLRGGQELKLVYPQAALKPEDFVHLNFDHFFLQPMDGPHLRANTQSTIEYCLANPKWRLSLQLHKVAGIP